MKGIPMYIHKEKGTVITDDMYYSLSPLARRNWMPHEPTHVTAQGGNRVQEQRRERDSYDDGSSFLMSNAIGAATDSALLGGLIGGDFGGGLLGDAMDGDLFD